MPAVLPQKAAARCGKVFSPQAGCLIMTLFTPHLDLRFLFSGVLHTCFLCLVLLDFPGCERADDRDYQVENVIKPIPHTDKTSSNEQHRIHQKDIYNRFPYQLHLFSPFSFSQDWQPLFSFRTQYSTADVTDTSYWAGKNGTEADSFGTAVRCCVLL